MEQNNEQTCLLCDQIKSSDLINIEPGRNQNLFNLLCQKLGVESVSRFSWNFEIEALPFCTHCLLGIYKLEELENNIANLELGIFEELERMKLNITKSVKKTSRVTRSITLLARLDNHNTDDSNFEQVSNLSSTHSHRFQEFRKEALECISSANSLPKRCIKSPTLSIPPEKFNLECKVTRNISTKRLVSITGIEKFSEDSCQSQLTATTDSLSEGEPDDQELALRISGECTSTTFVSSTTTTPTWNPIDVDDFVNDLLGNGDPSTPKWTQADDGTHYYGDVKVIKGEKGWKCDLCGFEVPPGNISPPRKTIEYHIRSKHFDYQKCTTPGCRKKCLSSAELEKHLEEDHISSNISKSQTQACSHCGKLFKKAGSLAKHERSHTIPSDDETSEDGREPLAPLHKSLKAQQTFQCQICGKTFSRKSNLVRHEECHVSKDERETNLCPYCPNMYPKDGISQHIRLVHKQGGKEINFVECPWDNCTSKFPHKSKLGRHIKAVHEKALPIIDEHIVQILSP